MPATPDEYGAAVHRQAFRLTIKAVTDHLLYRRTAYLDALVKRLDPAQVHVNKRCTDITPDAASGRSRIAFADGTSAEADVVLLANGMKCPQRKLVTGLESKESVAFGNTVCYRGLVTREGAAAMGVDTSFWNYPMVCLGHNKVWPINWYGVDALTLAATSSILSSTQSRRAPW